MDEDQVDNTSIDVDEEKGHISARQPNVTKEQYQKVENFYRQNNEALIGKDVFNLMWKNLTAELNDMGPPAYSDTEWKRKWSVYKYNKQKKRKMKFSDSEIPASDLHFDELSDSNQTVPSSELAVGFQTTDISEKLGEISQTLDVIIQNQCAMKESQEKSNKLLEEIAMKLCGFEIDKTEV